MRKKQWRVYYADGHRTGLLTKEEARNLLGVFKDARFMQKEEGWFKRRIWRR